MIYPVVVKSPWGWRFVAETCGKIPTYVWYLIRLPGYVGMCELLQAEYTEYISEVV